MFNSYMSNLGRISRDHSARLISHDGNQLQSTTNKKLDTALVQQTAVNTKLDNLSGAINNNIGDGTVKLQTYVYAHDVSNGLSRPLKCDSAGRLECSVDALEITAETINLSTDTLEAKTQAITDKLDTFAGAGNNNIGEGSVKLQTYLYARDVSAGNFKPLVCDGDAHLQIDCLSSALPSGAATEAKQDSGITHLATIAGDTTSLDTKVTACNTGAVVVSSSALPSGAATAALQGTANTALSEIEGAVENLELTVGTNTATAPTRSLAIGGKYADGTFRDIKVDNIGKVIIDTPTGSDIDVRLAAIQTAVETLDNAVDGNEIQVDVVTMPTVAVTLSGGATEAKQDVQETTLNAIQSAVEGTLTTTAAATLQTGSAVIGKLAANSGVDIGDVDVTSLPLTFNAGNADATCQRVVVATDDVNMSAIKTSLDNLDNAVDGNYLNVNANIAGSDVDANSGNKSAATQRVVIATDDVNLSAIKTAVELLDDAVGTDGSTGPSKCVSIGGTNLLGGSLQEISVDGDGHLQIDILSSALPSGAAQELSNTAIATKATLATTAEIKELLSGATVNQATLSAELDTEHYEKIRLFGETSAAVGSDIKLFGSNTSGGTFYFLNNSDLQAQSLTVSGLGTVHYVGATLENVPRYIKVFNNSGSTNHTFTKLYMVGSGGRVAV